MTADKIRLNIKKPWEVSKGHAPHRGGAGSHTPTPRKGSRGTHKRRAIKESDE